MKYSQVGLLAGALALTATVGIEGGYTQRRRRIQTTMPLKWWLHRKARLKMAKASRRANR